MNMSFFMKTIFLIASLILVVYVMRTLNTPSMATQEGSAGAAAVSLFTGDLRPLNWCLADTSGIEIVGREETFKSAQDISKYCEIFIEPVTQDDAQVEDYKDLIVATSKDGKKKIERNSRGVFRAEGMPFRSKQLEKNL